MLAKLRYRHASVTDSLWSMRIRPAVPLQPLCVLQADVGASERLESQGACCVTWDTPPVSGALKEATTPWTAQKAWPREMPNTLGPLVLVCPRRRRLQGTEVTLLQPGTSPAKRGELVTLA